MNGYVPMQYPMAGGMTLQSVPQTMPMVVPVSSQQPAQQPLYKTNHNEVSIQRKLEEQEKKLAERQAELAKLSEKLDTLKREQQKSLEQQQQQLDEQRKQQQHQQQQLEEQRKQQRQQQQLRRNQEQNQSSRPTQPPPIKPTSWNQSNATEYLSNKPTRFVNHPLATGHLESFLKSKGDVLPPSEFRDRHPTPPSQPARNATVPTPPSLSTTNGEYVDGPVLTSRRDGRTASVVLAVHTQKSSPHTPTKIYHAPNQTDLATTSFTVVMTEKSGRTQLHRKCAGPYLTYQNVKWKLFLRKEVRNPLVSNLELNRMTFETTYCMEIIWNFTPSSTALQ